MFRSIILRPEIKEVMAYCERLFSLDINQNHVANILKTLENDLQELHLQSNEVKNSGSKNFFAESEQKRSIAIQYLKDFSQSDCYSFRYFLNRCSYNMDVKDQLFIEKVHSFFQNKYNGKAPHSELNTEEIDTSKKALIDQSKKDLEVALRLARNSK